jgi:hypothetical protein
MEFRVGDWVRHGDNIYQFKEPSSEWSYQHSLKECTIWKPKVGEYCWFGFTNQWHPNNDYILGKLINIIDDNGCITYNCEPIHSEIDGNDFDYCEPFVGELPSFIKEL